MQLVSDKYVFQVR